MIDPRPFLVIPMLVAVAGIGCGSPDDSPESATDSYDDGNATEYGRQSAQTIRSAFGARASEITRNEVHDDWIWVQFKTRDQYPLTIDVVLDRHAPTQRLAFMLPGSGANFTSNFFTPTPAGDSLALFMIQNGYGVIGVTPREDGFPVSADRAVMDGWGLAQHRDDAWSVISRVEAALPSVHYMVVGHSAGAASALDIAAHYSSPQFDKVVPMEIDSFDPITQPTEVAMHLANAQAYANLIGAGVHADEAVVQFQQMFQAAAAAPTTDSGFPREAFQPGLAGNFTIQALLYFATIHTAWMPGSTTSETGFPETFSLFQGHAAGTFAFSPDPLTDTYAYSQTNYSTFEASVLEMNSGLYPMSAFRDYSALNGHAPACGSPSCPMPPYSIPWSGIGEKVVWINAELGYGVNHHASQLIQAAGNSNVHVDVVGGYGHADLAWGDHAKDDVWPLILQ